MANLPAVLRGWALEPRDLSLLASILFKMLDTDIHLGTDFPDWVGLCPMDVTERKSTWIGDWENCVRAGLVSLTPDEKPKFYSDSMHEFDEALADIGKPGNRFRAGLLLVELAASEGYWPEGIGDDFLKGLYISPEIRINILRNISKVIGFPADFGEELRSALEERVRELAAHTKITESRAFEGWRHNWVTQGICAPFWRGGMTAGAGSGEKTAFSKRDFISWAIGHLSSGLVMTEEAGLPVSGMILGAGGGLLLTPGLVNKLPPAALVQPETLLAVAAKYQLFQCKVLNRIGKETIAPVELAELLNRTRDCYKRAVRDHVGKIGSVLSYEFIDALFEKLSEMTRGAACS